MIMREIRHLKGVSVVARNITNIRYAYDTLLLAESENHLQALVTTLKEASKRKGLTANKKKTGVMVITKKEGINIQVEETILKQVDQFSYLGSLITWDGRSDREIHSKLSMRARRSVKCYTWSVLLQVRRRPSVKRYKRN